MDLLSPRVRRGGHSCKRRTLVNENAAALANSLHEHNLSATPNDGTQECRRR
jgi:hypothetical protein